MHSKAEKSLVILAGLFCLTLPCLSSCASSSRGGQEFYFPDGSLIVTKENQFRNQSTMLLTFAGDIMAHRPNYEIKPYDAIYKDIEPLLRQSALAFANLESPVDNSKPCSTFPNFNIHSDYAEAAISAGFNVFSLVNNHTNDQGLEGILATRDFFSSVEERTRGTDRPVYACGLKQNESDPLTCRLIECADSRGKPWRILFAAVTEVENRRDFRSWYDYAGTGESERAEFLGNLTELKERHSPDIFVLSIHCADKEYELSIDEGQRAYYHDILRSGADVVWVNHPHVAKDWEVVKDTDGVPRKIIFHSMGNTISAQRWVPQFNNPRDIQEYTGDGYLCQVRFLKDSGGIRIAQVSPVLITTYITGSWQFVIRILDDSFIQSLQKDGQKTWAGYMSERKNLMEQIKGKTSWL